MSLDRILGTWTTSMKHVQLSDPITGRQVFERVLDGAFVMQRASADLPDVPHGIALFEDTAVHYFDSRGVTRLFDLELTEDSWSMIRRDPDFWQRSTTRFVGSDVMEAVGENSHDGGVTWEHDFTMRYTRLES